jgi:rod shape-determining protein MreD
VNIVRFFKILVTITAINLIEQNINFYLDNFNIRVPLTFLAYSYFIFSSSKDYVPYQAFFFGLFLDFINGSLLGLNAISFLVVNYLLLNNRNLFKIISHLQICIFFGLYSFLYIGFNQIFLSIDSYSYILLFNSLIFNFIVIVVLSWIGFYFKANTYTKDFYN